MKVIPKGKVYNLTSSYNGKTVNKNDDSFYLELDKGDTLESFIKDRSMKVDLSLIKKVNFNKSSKFPRFKLAQNTDIKRCLDRDKADALISPDSPNFIHREYYIFYYSKQSDKYYKTYGRNSINDILNNFAVDRDIIEINNVIISVSEDIHDFINYILVNNKNNIITDSSLDEAVSATMTSATSDDINSINEFLASSDNKVVKLGTSMLTNYDIYSNAFTIGIMILNNAYRIYESSAYNNVAFKQLLASLEIDPASLKFCSKNSIPEYLNKFSKISTSDEDKKIGKKIMIDILNKELLGTLDHYNDAISYLNIKSKIELN